MKTIRTNMKEDFIMGKNEKDKTVEQEVVDVKAVEATVEVKKENWRTKAWNFCKRHKKGLIVGAAAVGLAIYGLTRKDGDDEDEDMTTAIEAEPDSVEDQEEKPEE